MLDRLTSDAAAALRSMKRMPFIVGGAIATLALAVGLNVAIFGLIHRALFAAPAHDARLALQHFAIGFAGLVDRHSIKLQTMANEAVGC